MLPLSDTMQAAGSNVPTCAVHVCLWLIELSLNTFLSPQGHFIEVDFPALGFPIAQITERRLKSYPEAQGS